MLSSGGWELPCTVSLVKLFILLAHIWIRIVANKTKMKLYKLLEKSEANREKKNAEWCMSSTFCYLVIWTCLWSPQTGSLVSIITECKQQCYWKHCQHATPFPHNQLQGNCLQAYTWYCRLPSIETWPISFKIALIKTRSYNTCEIVFPNTSQEWEWPSDNIVTGITPPLTNKYKLSYIYGNISKATASQKKWTVVERNGWEFDLSLRCKWLGRIRLK